MLALAATGAAEGSWLRADQQTGGKGRLGRQWQSPPGNLYASTLVRLRPHDPSPASLTFVVALAVDETLRLFAPDVTFSIKWPNDVLAGGAKLCGILLERADDAIVIGIGVNLAVHPHGLDRPVTSLVALGVAPPSPQIFAEALADVFARWLDQWRNAGLAAIRTAWLARAHPIGTALSVSLPDGNQMEGLFDGLDSDCALRLRLADGGVRAIHAGDTILI
jgi:BirA family transcriptional regulator, biotin operon repressor / biotin---[acetyl-CoA-carboxylase] ligase